MIYELCGTKEQKFCKIRYEKEKIRYERYERHEIYIKEKNNKKIIFMKNTKKRKLLYPVTYSCFLYFVLPVLCNGI